MTRSVSMNLRCSMAIVSENSQDVIRWYFDNKLSKHMTSTCEHLKDIKALKGGKVICEFVSNSRSEGK